MMDAWLDDGDVRVLHGDCIEVMRELAPESVDAIITDPPYGLEFMGKEWDRFAPQDTTARVQRSTGGSLDRDPATPHGRTAVSPTRSNRVFKCRNCGGWSGAFSESRRARQRPCECDQPDYEYAGAPASSLAFQTWVQEWATEALRVLKPGGHLAAFGGTRTSHRLASGIEDAGFEIRDTLAWLYGQGFPKSSRVNRDPRFCQCDEPERSDECSSREPPPGSASAFPQCIKCGKPNANGYGTALKPSFEPITLARKPLAGTVAQNVLAHGTGALNIDATRIGTDDKLGGGAEKRVAIEGKHEGWARPWMSDADAVDAHTARVRENVEKAESLGRWPANVILDPEAAAILDQQTGDALPKPGRSGRRGGNGFGFFDDAKSAAESGVWPADPGGGASRFFYTAKAASSERNDGLHDLPQSMPHDNAGHQHADGRAWDIPGSHSTRRANHHPTVKPVDLMRWLIRLLAPPGALILDPFAGSGTTGVAARLEQTRCILIEREAEYLPIIAGRLSQQALF